MYRYYYRNGWRLALAVVAAALVLGVAFRVAGLE